VFNFLTSIAYTITKEPVINKFEIIDWAYLYNNSKTKTQHANAFVNFEVDFSPLNNWNTNLIFYWVTASYSTGLNGKEQVSIIFLLKI